MLELFSRKRMETEFKVGDEIVCNCGACHTIMKIAEITDQFIICECESIYDISVDLEGLRKVTKLDKALK